VQSGHRSDGGCQAGMHPAAEETGKKISQKDTLQL
jgi:hypothetical protein